MEALNALLSKANESGYIDGLVTGKGLEGITPLQFEDDTILFNSTK